MVPVVVSQQSHLPSLYNKKQRLWVTIKSRDSLILRTSLLPRLLLLARTPFLLLLLLLLLLPLHPLGLRIPLRTNTLAPPRPLRRLLLLLLRLARSLWLILGTSSSLLRR